MINYKDSLRPLLEILQYCNYEGFSNFQQSLKSSKNVLVSTLLSLHRETSLAHLEFR